ncbi:MAG: dihydrolipoamide acetyltransferase family protein [Promethearchaeota archaeon]
MPRLDEEQEKGMVVEWLKAQGDTVTQGEEIVEVMSEKVSFIIEAPVTGTVHKIFVEEAEEVPIGTTIAIISEAEDPPDMLEKTIKEVEEKLKIEVPIVAEKEEIKVIEKEEEVKVKPERIKISPIAKRLATEHELDITQIEGTGPEGRIVKEDVLRVIEQGKFMPAAPEEERIQLTGVRKIIAERMTQSYRTAPHVTVMMDTDASNMVKLRKEFEEKTRLRLSYNAILIKAVTEALNSYKIFNSTIIENEIRIYPDINIGLAVALENRGLIVPIIPNADKKSLKELNTSIEDLVEKARQNRLSISEVKGGTFTVSNLGMYDIDGFTPILTPQQAAILGSGRIAKKPVVVNEEIVIKPMMTLSLSFDHRIVDGALAAQFLRHIKRTLETFTPTL